MRLHVHNVCVIVGLRMDARNLKHAGICMRMLTLLCFAPLCSIPDIPVRTTWLDFGRGVMTKKNMVVAGPSLYTYAYLCNPLLTDFSRAVAFMNGITGICVINSRSCKVSQEQSSASLVNVVHINKGDLTREKRWASKCEEGAEKRKPGRCEEMTHGIFFVA